MGSPRKRHPVREYVPGLLILLLLTCFFGVVILGTKSPLTQEQQIARFHQRHSGFYYVQGVKLAQKFAPAGAHNWPGWIDHQHSEVIYLGDGLWLAVGTVSLTDDPSQFDTWEVCVSEPEAAPIYVRVGKTVTGDVNRVLRQVQKLQSGMSL